VVALYNRPDRQVWPRGKEVVLVKRLLVVATAALVVAAMMVAMAMPALAARSAPTKQDA
jgi:heme/copper-type cytochrome/quinol oxidase subunit 3